MTGRKKPSHHPRKHPRVSKIPPGVYPVLKGAEAMRLLRALRDPEVVAEAVRIITDRAEELRSAVLSHVDRLDDAARQLDLGSVYDQAHEIRGLAGNAGLNATGRIANGLCRYLDAISRAKYPPDHELVALHLDAIARAAHAEDEATRLGETVANELAALVDKKLAEINDSERQA